MNAISLVHNAIQNQQSSRNDDKFHTGNYGVNGVKDIQHQRNLNDYAEELVAHHGRYQHGQYYLRLKELPESSQNELARLYLEYANRDASECVYGDDFTIEGTYLCALLSMLQNDCKETRERFAEVTRRNILVYYKDTLDEVLADACSTYHHNMNNEFGYYANQDRNTGEVSWERI